MTEANRLRAKARRLDSIARTLEKLKAKSTAARLRNEADCLRALAIDLDQFSQPAARPSAAGGKHNANR